MQRRIRLPDLFRYFYTWFLPAVTVLSLMVVSQITPRPLFFHSGVMDFAARVWIAVCLCANYILLGNLSKYRSWFYGYKDENYQSQGDIATRLWNTGLGVGLGIIVALITWWIFQVFLPTLRAFTAPIAILNALLCSIPIVARGRKTVF